MNKTVNKAQQVLFIFLGITIPTSIAITNMIIGLLAFSWILEGNFQKKLEEIKSSKWILSIFGLIVMYGLGMLWGDFHLNAEWQFQRLGLLLMFPILFTIDLKQETLKKGVIAFLLTTFISAVIAIAINNNIISPLVSYMSFFSSKWGISAFIKYNYHNVLLAIAFTISLYILFENKTKYRKILLLFIIAYAISIFTERGRAGQVIFNLSSIFYIVYYNINKKYILRGFAFVLLLFSFQAIIYNSTNVYKDRFDVVSNIIKNNGKTGKKQIEDIRYVFLRESLNRIVKKPIFGYGTGSFDTILNNETNISSTYSSSWNYKTPHNQYLYVWFELGILGLILLLMIFYYQIRELFKKQDGIHRVLLPLSFMFLMIIDSYFFIFIVTIAYIYLFTIYIKYQSE
jgi:O-antigen ligase